LISAFWLPTFFGLALLANAEAWRNTTFGYFFAIASRKGSLSNDVETIRPAPSAIKSSIALV
jgi:hypothetical protein